MNVSLRKALDLPLMCINITCGLTRRVEVIETYVFTFMAFIDSVLYEQGPSKVQECVVRYHYAWKPFPDDVSISSPCYWVIICGAHGMLIGVKMFPCTGWFILLLSLPTSLCIYILIFLEDRGKNIISSRFLLCKCRRIPFYSSFQVHLLI